MRILWPVLFLSTAAFGSPDGVIAELLYQTQSDTLSEDWLQRNLSPELAIQPEVYQRWLQLLTEDSEIHRTIGSAQGITEVTEGPGYSRVTLSGPPDLSFTLAKRGEKWRIRSVELSTCSQCTEEERYIRSLLHDIQHEGPRGQRLLPDLDLSMDAYFSTNRSIDRAPYTATYERWLNENGPLWDALKELTWRGQTGSVVHLESPDGHKEDWTLRYNGVRWQIDYQALHEDSLLRLTYKQARSLRSLKKRRVFREQNWRPELVATASPGATIIADHAIGAHFAPDETLWLILYDLDASLSLLVHYDPITGELLNSLPLPRFSEKTYRQTKGWYQRWDSSLSPDGSTLGLLLLNEALVVDLDNLSVSSLTVPPNTTHLLLTGSSSQDDIIYGTSSGRIYWGDAIWKTPAQAAVKDMTYAPSQGVTVLDETGTLSTFRGSETPEPVRLASTCAGHTTGFAHLPSYNLWAAQCDGDANAQLELVPVFEGDGRRIEGKGQGFGGLFWNEVDRELWMGTHSGVARWTPSSDRPEPHFGTGAFHTVTASHSGEFIIALRRDGTVVLWERHAVPPTP